MTRFCLSIIAIKVSISDPNQAELFLTFTWLMKLFIRIFVTKTHWYNVLLIDGEDCNDIGLAIGRLHRLRSRPGCSQEYWQRDHYCRLWCLDYEQWRIPNQHHHHRHQIQNNRTQIGHWPNPNLINIKHWIHCDKSLTNSGIEKKFHICKILKIISFNYR